MKKSFYFSVFAFCLVLISCDLIPLLNEDNTPPVADAGESLSVTVGETIQLDGTGSTDNDGDTLSYLWLISSKPEGSQTVFPNETSSRPTFIADTAGIYTIDLIVNDGTEDSQIDSILITAVEGGSGTDDPLTMEITALSASHTSTVGTFQQNGAVSAAVSSNQLDVLISTVSDDPYDPKVFLNLPTLSENHFYRISFTASADTEKQIHAKVGTQLADYPYWGPLYDNSSADYTLLETSSRSFTIEFTTANLDLNANLALIDLVFELGTVYGDTGVTTVHISDVVLEDSGVIQPFSGTIYSDSYNELRNDVWSESGVLSFDAAYPVTGAEGSTCARMDLSGGSTWGGFAFADYNSLGFDISGYSSIRFLAKADANVNIELGLNTQAGGAFNANQDGISTRNTVSITTEWIEYTLNLADILATAFTAAGNYTPVTTTDLTKVTTFIFSGQSDLSVPYYIDNVYLSTEPAASSFE